MKTAPDLQSRRRDHDPAGGNDRRLSRLPGRPAHAPGESATRATSFPSRRWSGPILHGGLVLGAFLPGRRGGGDVVRVPRASRGPALSLLAVDRRRARLPVAWAGLRDQTASNATIARAEGIERIAWAFDPLQAGNAHFNLARLGATAGRYVENMYGLRTDALNAGVPTDRLIAEWDTGGEATATISVRLQSRSAPLDRNRAGEGD